MDIRLTKNTASESSESSGAAVSDDAVSPKSSFRIGSDSADIPRAHGSSIIAVSMSAPFIICRVFFLFPDAIDAAMSGMIYAVTGAMNAGGRLQSGDASVL